LLKPGIQMLTWASFCSEDPWPFIDVPSHVGFLNALAVPGAASAANAAAETAHADSKRRTENELIA
jgi:hypothetical protein